MLSHHLPHLLGHLSTLGRHAFMYGHASTRAVFGAVLRLQSPRDAFRVALRQSRFSVEPKQSGTRKKLPLLIHYHIFKNAGSSFEWALERAFGRRFLRFDSPDPRGVVSARQIARLVRDQPDLYAISS